MGKGGSVLLAAAAVAVALLHAREAWSGDVVDKYDGGATKAKYATNDQGQKEGPYAEYYEDGKISIATTYHADLLDGSWTSYYESGKVHVRASYKAGKRNGKWDELSPEGDLEFTATYVDDKLQGKVEAFQGKRSLTVQTWRGGDLATIDGVPAHPKSRESIGKTLKDIAAGDFDAKAPTKPRGKQRKETPPPSPTEAGSELTKDRTVALREVKAYRYLCDVPYADLTLEDDPNAHAQAAAEVCAHLGRIDHEPPNPGLPEAQYQFGLVGTKHCNLHTRGAVGSVPGYMDDSDPSNINRVGHRRWCLNPAMTFTGFGEAKGAEDRMFSAMWVIEAGRGAAPDFDAVCYPPRGWMPVEMFGAQQAWSVELNLAKFPHAPAQGAGVQVNVIRLDARFVRAEKPLDLDLLKVNTEDIAIPYCIIFRPKDLDLSDGAAYLVEVSGLDSKAKKPATEFRYMVHFCSMPESVAESGDK